MLLLSLISRCLHADFHSRGSICMFFFHGHVIYFFLIFVYGLSFWLTILGFLL